MATSFAPLALAQTDAEKIDQVLSGYANAERFTGSVLVYKNGKTLLSKGYGWKNAAQKMANDDHGIFQIYSVTKTFTSTLILKLVQDGKLSLDTKLSHFYPEIG